MKGLCTVASGEICQLLFTSGELPDVGAYYFLEKAEGGTGAQNRAFHSLLMEYWRSGMHSYDSKGFDDFKNQVKRHLGAGFEAYIYVDMENGVPKIRDAKTIEEIPDYIKTDPEFRDIIRGRLKSWSDYSKKERKSTIDNLITEMIEVGVNTKKFQEILSGLEEGK